MSQEKVDRYKQESEPQADNEERRRENIIRKCIVMLCGLLLVVWIGYSAYDMYDSGKEPDKAQIDYQAFDKFAQDITGAGAEEAQE